MVSDICKQTDKVTDRQTDRHADHNTLQPYQEQSNKMKTFIILQYPARKKDSHENTVKTIAMKWY